MARDPLSFIVKDLPHAATLRVSWQKKSWIERLFIVPTTSCFPGGSLNCPEVGRESRLMISGLIRRFWGTSCLYTLGCPSRLAALSCIVFFVVERVLSGGPVAEAHWPVGHAAEVVSYAAMPSR